MIQLSPEAKKEPGGGAMSAAIIQERRQSQRFQPSYNTTVISPEGVGRLIDISRGGFSARYFDTSITPQNKHTNILVSGGCFISNIPIKLVSVASLGSSPSRSSGQKIGFQFNTQELSESQKLQIDYLIQWYTEA